MEAIYKTGNETVDRLSRLHITGNIIPSAWYRTIRRETGKPYLNAIVILSDIVYWYRAAEIRDEGSGQLLGYRKRFKADLLQRSYQQMADQFGISKRDATNAVVELEKLGVIRRVFRTLTAGGQLIPNVLFLELNVDVLEQLTYPEEYQEKEDYDMEGQTYERSAEECHSKKRDVSPDKERGITYLSGISPQTRERPVTVNRETNTETTYREYDTDYLILSYQEEKERFEKQIEYDILKRDYGDRIELEELVTVAVEVLTSTARTIRVNREEKPAELVKGRYRQLNMFHIQYVLECMSETETRARNIRAVMITALYNAASTMENHYNNLYQYHLGRGEGREMS